MPSAESVNKKEKDCPETACEIPGKKKTLKNGGGCSHLDFDSLFIKTEDGCILRCAECKRIVLKHCPCTSEQNVTDVNAGMMPCTHRRTQVVS